MKTKHLYIFAVIFLALAAVNVIQKIHAAKNPSGEVRREEWQPFISADQAAKIIFSREGHATVGIVKEGKGWKVETLSGVSADSHKMNELLTQLNQLKAELRAEGESLYERFGIADKQAFRIQILDSAGAAIVDFLMGEHRAGKGVFIRLSGKTKIYFTPDDLPAIFGLFADLEQAGPPPLFFADLKLIPEGFEQIQRFDVTETRSGKDSSLAALERPSIEAGTPWKFVSGVWKFSPGHEKVEEYLARLLSAQAVNIAMNVPAFKTEMEIMLRDIRGKVLRLQFSKSGSKWLVKRAPVENFQRQNMNEDPVFEVSELVFDDLKTEDARFVAENPLHFNLDEENTVELIYDGKTERFSKTSGWPSAAALLDAASRLEFTGLDKGVTAKDLSVLPPTHRLRVMREGKAPIEMGFYLTNPDLTEIKTVISGQDPVFKVSRAFFDDIFVPAAAPPKEEENAAAMKYSVV